jgi:Glycosyl transferase family 11
MFQYALGRNLAKKYKTEVVFDTTFLTDRFPRGGTTFFNYDLDIFGIVPELTPLSKIANAMPIPGVWLGFDVAFIKARDVLGLRKFIKEPANAAFEPKVFTSGSDILLWGYWQSEKYFKEDAQEIRAAFAFKSPLAGEAARIAEEIKKTNSVALHVRRGDYVTAKSTLKLMGDTNLAYYKDAIAHIAANVRDPHFFVFSNDVAWCEANLKTTFPMTYVPASASGPKNAYHFELMSLSKHNIVANSTYSWWAGWLNANPAKIVVAPRRWFNDPAMDDKDIVPAEWVKI